MLLRWGGGVRSQGSLGAACRRGVLVLGGGSGCCLVTWISAYGSSTRGAPLTSMTLDALGPGHGVTGFAATGGFDPTKGYSGSDPSSGFEQKDEGFAGVIIGRSGNDTLQLFCIDLHTNTYVGYGYKLGDWGTAAVPHVGYVARILNSYYPKVPDQPAAWMRPTGRPRFRPRSGSSATATCSRRAGRIRARGSCTTRLPPSWRT